MASSARALASRDLNGVAEFIRSGRCQTIGFLTGAGVSVAAGIPDFRSAGGMYDTLRPELLTASEGERDAMRRDPTAVVSWDIFSVNQLPYLELRRPFILGLRDRQWKATLGHFFVKVCHERGLLRRLYTQNIDGLDMQTGTPGELIVPVHGTMGRAACEFCSAAVDDFASFCDTVRTSVKDISGRDDAAPSESMPIPCQQCGRPGVKPTTVLYGRSLPEEFFSCMELDMAEIDLMIIMGTSLTVGPANMIPAAHKRATRAAGRPSARVVLNMDVVGEDVGLNYRDVASDDVFIGGPCDKLLLELAFKCGWVDDLMRHRAAMAPNSVQLLRDSTLVEFFQTERPEERKEEENGR